MFRKRLLALMLSFAMTAQLGFVVAAENNEVLFDLGIKDMIPGDMQEYGRGLSAKSTMSVVMAGDDKFIKVLDKDMEVQGGITIPDLPLGEKVTVSFDFRPMQGPVNAYITGNGNPVSSVLSSSIGHYTAASGGFKASGMVTTVGKWANITIVIDPVANTFDFYKNGRAAIVKSAPRPGSTFAKTFGLTVFSGDAKQPTEFDIKNVKVYRGEVVPPDTEKVTDRKLIDFSTAQARLNEALKGAIAMSIGNSMARVDNSYVRIDPDNKYVAPFVTEDGYTLVPTRFTTEIIGGSVEVLSSTSFRFSKDGTVMEINMGDKNAIINGKPVEMPTAPVIKHDRLFLPLRFAAETYGKTVFWDDRGLIVISDEEVLIPNQEDIIKPLLNQIRQQTTLTGNTKYSDVNFSSRYYRKDGHMDGTTTPQIGTLDASKRFMATVDRWTYDRNGETVKSVFDQGLIVQGSFQPIFNDGSKPLATFFLDGSPYQRYDGAWGAAWGCVSDPELFEFVLKQGKQYIDIGLTAFQFDDYPINANYGKGGCFCDYCMEEFPKYLASDAAPPELIAECGITDPANFNIKEYLKTEFGVTDPGQYEGVINNKQPIDELWGLFNIKRSIEFHHRLKKALSEYAGCDVSYSANSGGAATGFTGSWVYQLPVNGIMGESFIETLSPQAVYTSMLFSRAYDVTNVVSAMAESEGARDLLNSAIPMFYATSQFVLVPWDVWLFGSTRFYTTVEALEHNFEFPREYPWLFDNYEIPEIVAYVYDMNAIQNTNSVELGTKVMADGLPARAIIRRDNTVTKTFDDSDFKGIQALIPATDLSGITAEEKAKLENSGIPMVDPEDKETMDYLKSTYWMTESSNPDVYTTLKQNHLYDDAPVIVHAVNYNNVDQENIEIDVNNLYLPEGDSFTVNVYRPNRNSESITVKRGEGSTKLKLDSINRWAILEICGPGSVRHEAKFDLGTGLNGIGLGTRVSNDKVIGTADDFKIITYSEGINSSTYGDNGNQDEAAFIYKYLGEGILKNASVSAKFSEAEGSFGVMAREGIYSNARFAALVYDREKGLRMAYREDVNEPVGYKDISNRKPAYMKLERAGREYVGYVSKDGKTYEEVGRVEITLDETIAGVFASSYDGKRSECRVRDLAIKSGKTPEGKFTSFNIRYKDGKISESAANEKLEFELSTEDFTNIPPEEVNTTFVISDDSVLKIKEDGTLVPKKAGKVTVTANVEMGLRKASDSTIIEVTPVDHTVFKESFDSGKLPDGIEASMGKASVVDGALRLTVDSEGTNAITRNILFDQPKTKNMFFEFDFRAHFGETQPTTGAGVLWGNSDGWAMTSDVNEWNWFFRDDQRLVASMEGDRWYHIKIYINYEEQYADVYVDDEQIVEKGLFKQDGVQPDGVFWVRGWRLGLDTYYEWDNFNFYFE